MATFSDDTAARGVRASIWLTPFDLGIRQEIELRIAPGEYAEIYQVRVLLRRLSGDDRSWYRMNRTFMKELRKQFLEWRSLTSERIRGYVEESGRLFHGLSAKEDRVTESDPAA